MITAAVPEAPADQRPLMGAHGRMLLEAVGWLDATKVETKTFGDTFVVLLAKRVIQLGYALETLCEDGYAGDAAPIARTMMNGAMNLVYLAEAEHDCRAAAYVAQERVTRKKRIEDILAQCRADRAANQRPLLTGAEIAQMQADDVRLTADEEGKLGELAKQGIVPKKKGNNPTTWTGYTERELYVAMKAQAWYLSFYRLFSDQSHVSANALTSDLEEVLKGAALYGPKFADPQYVIRASHQAVLQVLFQWDRLYHTGKLVEAKAIDQRMVGAIATYMERHAASP